MTLPYQKSFHQIEISAFHLRPLVNMFPFTTKYAKNILTP